jgi:hypothetical protein
MHHPTTHGAASNVSPPKGTGHHRPLHECPPPMHLPHPSVVRSYPSFITLGISSVILHPPLIRPRKRLPAPFSDARHPNRIYPARLFFPASLPPAAPFPFPPSLPPNPAEVRPMPRAAQLKRNQERKARITAPLFPIRPCAGPPATTRSRAKNTLMIAATDPHAK